MHLLFPRLQSIGMIKGPVNEALKPLNWLAGTWKSVSAKGFYPTIKPFTYCEEMSFTSVGQPILNYNSVTWHPTEKSPMHLESGFLRIKPNTNEVAFMVGHNFGVTTLEEGTVTGNCLHTSTTQVGRMSFGKPPAVIGIERIYSLNEQGMLELKVLMETEHTALTEHLNVVYEKIE